MYESKATPIFGLKGSQKCLLRRRESALLFSYLLEDGGIGLQGVECLDGLLVAVQPSVLDGRGHAEDETVVGDGERADA